MNRKTLIRDGLLTLAICVAFVGWRQVFHINAELRRSKETLELARQEAASANEARTKQDEAELQRKNAQLQELVRLRGEVNQLRSSAKDLEKLRNENQRLRDAAVASTVPSTPPTEGPKGDFPREAWAFSGYATPEAALISSIWSMKEGNPKTYLDSLAPEEQARMAKVWENKSEAEVAAKHQQDVSAITGMRVLDRKAISAEEVQMSVYIQGVDRFEKVSMKLVNDEWKFAGFIREPKK